MPPAVPHPTEAEVPVAEALRFIAVSEEYVVGELQAGRLQGRQVDGAWMIDTASLAGYVGRMRDRQDAALEAMARDADALGLDY